MRVLLFHVLFRTYVRQIKYDQVDYFNYCLFPENDEKITSLRHILDLTSSNFSYISPFACVFRRSSSSLFPGNKSQPCHILHLTPRQELQLRDAPLMCRHNVM